MKSCSDKRLTHVWVTAVVGAGAVMLIGGFLVGTLQRFDEEQPDEEQSCDDSPPLPCDTTELEECSRQHTNLLIQYDQLSDSRRECDRAIKGCIEHLENRDKELRQARQGCDIQDALQLKNNQ
jgi:hypothetical protein